jgi:lipoprotein-anchoring transpeptidase ErfK/SrfK
VTRRVQTPAGVSRRSGGRFIAAAALLVAAAILLVSGLVGGGDAPSPSPAAVQRERAARLPSAPASAFAIGPPVALERHARETTWAAVRRDVTVRRRPSPTAPAVGRLRADTPERTTNIVPLLARRRSARGELWLRVRIPALPNGATGWVPRDALGAYGTARTRLVVDLARRRATVLRDGRVVLRFPVGIGTPDAPTPRGEFVVRNRLTRYKSAFYGPIALGTSARSATLTDWPGGGYIGIHGTDRPDLLPGAVSHGCIRLRNADMIRLARALPIGSPLTIR